MMDQKQHKNVEYFNYLGSVVTNDTNFTWEIKSKIVIGKNIFQQQESFHKESSLKFEEKLVNCCIWSIGFYGAVIWRLRKVDHK
jgi:hypothetical protein